MTKKRRKTLHFWTPEERKILIEHRNKTASWLKKKFFSSDRTITTKSISTQRYMVLSGRTQINSQFGKRKALSIKKASPTSSLKNRMSRLEIANNVLLEFKNQMEQSNRNVIQSIKKEGVYSDSMIQTMKTLLDKTSKIELAKKEQELIQNLV